MVDLALEKAEARERERKKSQETLPTAEDQ